MVGFVNVLVVLGILWNSTAPPPELGMEVSLRPIDFRPTDFRPTDLRPTDLRPTNHRPTNLRPTDLPCSPSHRP